MIYVILGILVLAVVVGFWWGTRKPKPYVTRGGVRSHVPGTNIHGRPRQQDASSCGTIIPFFGGGGGNSDSNASGGGGHSCASCRSCGGGGD